jgi:hypothetical protein
LSTTIITTTIPTITIPGITIPGIEVILPIGDFTSDFQITGGIPTGIRGVGMDAVVIRLSPHTAGIILLTIMTTGILIIHRHITTPIRTIRNVPGIGAAMSLSDRLPEVLPEPTSN